jgi:hypothetical protein
MFGDQFDGAQRRDGGARPWTWNEISVARRNGIGLSERSTVSGEPVGVELATIIGDVVTFNVSGSAMLLGLW